MGYKANSKHCCSPASFSLLRKCMLLRLLCCVGAAVLSEPSKRERTYGEASKSRAMTRPQATSDAVKKSLNTYKHRTRMRQQRPGASDKHKPSLIRTRSRNTSINSMICDCDFQIDTSNHTNTSKQSMHSPGHGQKEIPLRHVKQASKDWRRSHLPNRASGT